MNGNLLVNTNGVQTRTLVNYYNKSTDNGHNVYYIELVPMKSGQSECTVTFFTSSENAQPHYSFWFGAPLVRTGTATLGSFSVRVSAPNTASTAALLSLAADIPDRAWVNTVTINKLSSTGDSLTRSVKLNVTLPGATSGMVAMSTASSPLVFNDFPSNTLSHDAAGTYRVYISDVSWSPATLTTGTYLYRGQASVEYLYAFGA